MNESTLGTLQRSATVPDEPTDEQDDSTHQNHGIVVDGLSKAGPDTVVIHPSGRQVPDDQVEDLLCAAAGPRRAPDDGQPVATDGAGPSVTQAALSRAPSTPQLVEADRDDANHVCCPDCGQQVSRTKRGHPLPDDVDGAETVYGWYCSNCENVMPCNATGPRATGYRKRMVGIEVELRNEKEQWVPVPRSQVGDDHPAVQGGDTR